MRIEVNKKILLKKLIFNILIVLFLALIFSFIFYFLNKIFEVKSNITYITFVIILSLLLISIIYFYIIDLYFESLYIIEINDDNLIIYNKRTETKNTIILKDINHITYLLKKDRLKRIIIYTGIQKIRFRLYDSDSLELIKNDVEKRNL